jgi:hypothetical protein
MGVNFRLSHRRKYIGCRVLRKMFGSQGDEITGTGGDCINRSFINSTHHQILFGGIKSMRLRWAWHMARLRDRKGVYKGFGGETSGKGATLQIWA